MALMNFAYLKNRSAQKPGRDETKPVAPAPSGYSPEKAVPATIARPAAGLLSFAHLKKKTAPAVEEKPVEDIPRRTAFRIPAVMPTARLMAVNYCQGCGRFLRAEEGEKDIPYGHCRRVTKKSEDGTEMESWKVIPVHATVARCFYQLQEKEKGHE